MFNLLNYNIDALEKQDVTAKIYAIMRLYFPLKWNWNCVTIITS